mmetsp:Transcript_9289/g.18304  ORF Transcript_9289/g.18304 Transcript_9289/m.18304 type:complete len:712 (-) Transcript_9289:255-2390(-)
MTPATIRSLCLKNQGYECEEINDKLYLHFQGFKEIGGLEKYTGLKCLYLESNGLTEVKNLNHLTELRCLYLQQNLIRSVVPPSFEGLSCLVTLDISSNLLEDLSGIACLESLQTLNASKNRFSSSTAVEELTSCTKLVSVDLRGNFIEDGEALIDILSQLSAIAAVYLQGNPCVRSMKHYRKVIVSHFDRLTYLDERPVDEKERILAKAWSTGGKNAEDIAREQWKSMEVEQTKSHVASWKAFRERANAEREQKIAAALAAGEPVPQPKSYVSYRSVDPAEEADRQARRRELALAEAEAERQSVLDHGIQMMGIQFAAETAKRNGSTFETGNYQVQDDTSAPVPPVAEASAVEQSGKQGVNADVETATSNSLILDSEKNSSLDIGSTEWGDEHTSEEAENPETEEMPESDLSSQNRIKESLKLHYARKSIPVDSERNTNIFSAEIPPETYITEANKDNFQIAPQRNANNLTEGVATKNQSENTTSSQLKESDEIEVDFDTLEEAVRKSLFDFSAAAILYNSKSGHTLDADACRKAFAKAKKQTRAMKPALVVVGSNVDASKYQETQNEHVLVLDPPSDASFGSTEVMGRPMPTIKVQAPAQLPSFLDFQDSDDEDTFRDEENQVCIDFQDDANKPYPTPQKNPMPSKTLHQDGFKCDSDETDRENNSTEITSPTNHFVNRLTRQEILKSLHGNDDHPLNVDMEDTYFEGMD